MTPDKIYLRQDEVLERMPWIAECYNPDRDTAYIREDALLEWAKETEEMRVRVPIEAYNNEDYQAGFIDGFNKFRRMLTNKLESL